MNQLVTIIIPCRNEEKIIGRCLDSIINTDYPTDLLEILIIDGMSNDSTREIISNYIKNYAGIRIVDNPDIIKPIALNRGIKEAKGEIIIRLDAHAVYEKDYISKCVKYLNEYNADNVGGVRYTKTDSKTIIGKSLAIAVSHPFAVGNAHYRIGSSKPRYVDTVFGGCYKKEIFDKIGFFNTELIRAQDREFNFRLVQNGGKILLAPDIKCYYYARSSFWKYFKWIFDGGFWVYYVYKFTKKHLVSWRNLIPLLFVIYILFGAILSVVFPILLVPFLSGLIAYFILNIFFSLKVCINNKTPLYLFSMPVIFLFTHLFYGLGSGLSLIKIYIFRN